MIEHEIVGFKMVTGEEVIGEWDGSKKMLYNPVSLVVGPNGNLSYVQWLMTSKRGAGVFLPDSAYICQFNVGEDVAEEYTRAFTDIEIPKQQIITG